MKKFILYQIWQKVSIVGAKRCHVMIVINTLSWCWISLVGIYNRVMDNPNFHLLNIFPRCIAARLPLSDWFTNLLIFVTKIIKFEVRIFNLHSTFQIWNLEENQQWFSILLQLSTDPKIVCSIWDFWSLLCFLLFVAETLLT